MPYHISSTYPDDQTRTTDIPELVEKFIKDNWDETKTGIASNKVGWGKWGSAILSSGVQATLRADVLMGTRQSRDLGGARWRFEDIVNIDVFVMNNATTVSRDPRAMKIQKFLEELFPVNQAAEYLGIFTMTLRQAFPMSDPSAPNIDRRRIQVSCIYEYVVNNS
jgi:hypothetical protein